MKPLRPGTRPPWTIAHRGASAARPENTVAAFDEALAEGCDGIELDVQLSRDGVPVVYHDRTLHRAGGGRRRVSQVDAREILELDMGSWFDRRFKGERIPTLERVLQRYARRTRLLVEIKARERDRRAGTHLALARATGAMIRSMRLEGEVLLLSFDAEALAAASGAAPRLATALNLKPPRQVTATFRGRLASHFALSADVRTLSPAVVEAAHALGKPVLVFTCNTARTVQRALRCGADAVMSDRPAWLRQTIERHQDAAAAATTTTTR